MAGVDDFSAPAEVHCFAGLLSDLDGTLIDSTEAITKHWHKIGKELGVDPAVILATSHGRRSIDTLRLYDPKKATWDYVSHIEGRIPWEFGQDAKEVPGAFRLLEALETAGAPWAIVTSGTGLLVEGWIRVLKMAHPRCLVVAEDVETGKPDPACYNLARKRLGLPDDAEMLVLEDSPAGVRAGKAAGCKVVGLITTHSAREVQEAGADWITRDLRSVTLRAWDDKTSKLEVEIRDGLLIQPGGSK